jgi:hypothetical protein
LLAILFPAAIVFTRKARTSRRGFLRPVGPALWVIFGAALLATSSGCGGHPSSPNVTGPTNLRYTPPGSYQYEVTASGTSGGNQITQTVTLNLTVQ